MELIAQIRGKLGCNKYPLMIFFILSLIPFYWLRGHPIGVGDTGIMAFFYNPEYVFNVHKYTWMPQILTGYSSGQSMTVLQLSGFFRLLAILGFNNYTQQAFVYFLVLFVSMISCYLFTYEIFDYRMDKKLIATTSAILYAFNPLSMINYWYMGMLSIYLMPFIPTILFLLLLVLRKQNFIYILLMLLILSLSSIVFLNPAFVIPVMTISLLFLIYQILLSWKNKEKFKTLFIYIASATSLFFLTSAWFILPFIFSVMDYYTSAVTVMDPLQALISVSHSLSLDTFFRLIPLKLDSGMWAYKDPSWRYYYGNPLFILIGIFTFFIILTPILFIKKDKNVLFFTLLLVIGLFLCNGLNAPFGYLFKYMFTHIPFFDMFRSSFNKFMPFLLISSAVLFGVGVAVIYTQIKHKFGIQISKLIIIIILFLVCGIYAFPMWTGSVVNTPVTIRGNEISSFVEVPTYYQNISEYFHSDSTDYRVLSLPLRPSTYVGYNWEYGYDGPDMTWLLYKHSTISYLNNNYDVSAKILSNLDNQNLNNLYKMTSIFGIKYIVVQNDVDIVHGNYNGKKLNDQQEIESMLDQLDVPFIDSFGKLDLYQIPYTYYLPHIYTTSSQIIIPTFDDFNQIINTSTFIPNEQIIIISSQNQNKSIPEINSLAHPNIFFQKINPTKYKVKIENVHEPFWLIFSESYHPDWQAYLNIDSVQCNPITNYSNVNVTEGQHESKFFELRDLTLISSKPIPEKYHVLVNGYANAWYIDPNELDTGKNFVITLYFKPQSYFYIGLLISLITFIICVSYLLWDLRKRKTTRGIHDS